MKAITVGVLLAGLAVSANAFPGLYRFSGGYGGIHVTGAHLKDDNYAVHSANSTGFSYRPTPATKVVVRALTDLPGATLSGSIGVSGYTDGSAAGVQVGESLDASTGLVDVDEAAHGFADLDASTGVVDTALSGYGSIHLVDVADSAPGIIKKLADPTQGSVDEITDSTQDSVNEILDSAQGASGIVDSAQGSVDKVADSTHGAVDIADSTQISVNDVSGSTQDAVVVADSNLRPYITKVHSVTVRPIIPNPTVIPPGVFPRGASGVYGSYGSGYATSTMTSSTFRISPVSHHSTVDFSSGIKAVAPPSKSTDAVTSTITQSVTSTVTRQIALNPSYTDPSATDQPCTAATTITVTVVATNVVTSHSPILVGSTVMKYSNATVSSTVGDSSSTFTTVSSIRTTVDPCAQASLPGFVGQQLASGSQIGGASCTAVPIVPITAGSTDSTSATATSTPSISAGTISTTNVNVAFLAGFAAVALFV